MPAKTMRIPVLKGVYVNQTDYRVAYPINLTPIAQGQGISDGYLRPAEGLVNLGFSGPGPSRGAIEWRGTHYRVFGRSFCSVDAEGNVTVLDRNVGGPLFGEVTMDRSFDYLSLSDGENLYLYDGNSLRLVPNTDNTPCVDHVWIQGFFMCTDGEFLTVTELDNPFVRNPIKYASSEADPDPIKALLRVRDEVYVLNRYTIEVFTNVGGNNFPFQPVPGAQVRKGTVGLNTCCVFGDGVAYMGGGYNDGIGVWYTEGARSIKISDRELDLLLKTYTTQALEQVVLEEREDEDHHFLYIHLPDRTYVYDFLASRALEVPVFHILRSGVNSSYRARYFLRVYDNWWCSDPLGGLTGFLSNERSDHWGERVPWEFSTGIVYNESKGALVQELELIGLPGKQAFGDKSIIYSDYSDDGETFSDPDVWQPEGYGARQERISFFLQGPMGNWRIQRFRGDSAARLTIARLEAQIEPLRYGL